MSTAIMTSCLSLDHAVDEQFIRKPHRSMILASDQPSALFDQIINYQHVSFNKSEWALHMTERSKQTE
jgi:hypothetical protein